MSSATAASMSMPGGCPMNTPPNEPALSATNRIVRTSAGQPICVEGQERVPVQPPDAVPPANGGRRPLARPTAADLAGVPICVEGREDLRVRRVVRRLGASAAVPDDNLPH